MYRGGCQRIVPPTSYSSKSLSMNARAVTLELSSKILSSAGVVCSTSAEAVKIKMWVYVKRGSSAGTVKLVVPLLVFPRKL
jgi:hypothetical protein